KVDLDRLFAAIAQAERDAVGRRLAADRAFGARKLQRKRFVEQRVECRLAGLSGAFAVDFWAGRLRERAPITAVGDGRQRLIEKRFVTFEQKMRQDEASRCGSTQISSN